MPLPKPRGGEDRDTFISRCMESASGEFESQDQALAVCHAQWRDRGKAAPAPIETKTLPLAQTSLEVKAEEGRPLVVTGYISTFGNTDLVGDVVEKGAYERTLKEWRERPWPMPLLLNHNQDQLVGKWVELREDSRGLFGEGELTPDHSLASDVAASLRHGALSGISIGFRLRDFERSKSGIRHLRDIDLIEASIVTSPANPMARVVGLKSADEIKSLREFEAFLREHGWSRREAQVIGTKGFSSLARESEAEDGAEQPRADGESERRDDGNEAAESAAPTRQEAMVEQVGPNLDELRLLAERLRQLATAA